MDAVTGIPKHFSTASTTTGSAFTTNINTVAYAELRVSSA